MRWREMRDKMFSKNDAAFFHRLDGEDQNSEGCLASSSFNHIVKDRLASIGIVDPNFGGHSARAGGATAAAKAAIEARHINAHGRWKSDAVYIYIHDTKAGILKLNTALGGFTNPTAPQSNNAASSSSSSSSV